MTDRGGASPPPPAAPDPELEAYVKAIEGHLRARRGVDHILTRKRVRQSLERTLCQPCPYCTGSGLIKTVSTVCTEIFEEVRKLAEDLQGEPLLLRVNPEVARALDGEESSLLSQLTELVGQPIVVQGDPLLHQEQFDVVPR